LVIEGIRSLLQHEKNMEWMGHAMNAASCLDYLKRHRPDVILMDVNLPDKSGTELCQEVKKLYPNVLILGLSTFNQQAVVRNMIDNGASGYVLKNATKEELLEAIELVINGETYFSQEVVHSLNEPQPHQPVITRREKEVLQLIAEGLTNGQIADKLFISIPTVNTHRKSIIEKFDVKNTAALIGKAIKTGII
ncbi:MAG TPA: response regulator transcription factor, partial [Cyclobacteriaceae bacterium]|nr:response regulator transcription factor [Cyclobacteriaceae bacterium]